jgi:hypothetical protein
MVIARSFVDSRSLRSQFVILKAVFSLRAAIAGILIACLPASVGAAQPELPRLERVKHLAPKGRVQDREYNKDAEIDRIVAMGVQAVPLLIKELGNENDLGPGVADYWPRLRVADLAFMILTDLFLEADWQTSTIPGLAFDEFLGPEHKDRPAQDRMSLFVEEHGRKPIIERWNAVWSKYGTKLLWDEKCRCIRPRDETTKKLK